MADRGEVEGAMSVGGPIFMECLYSLQEGCGALMLGRET